ncbi:hypothetical protein CCACVL1_09750 [Corchorus capsularis]|uniref:Uncharacterized protein n=1 Tax=Corchorus capsularis TaxID=210143 RepID=A0A1R3IUJ6_COCAP|nr:hypothetical protein CCACVL1_09750 [Corchorus capsularis]
MEPSLMPINNGDDLWVRIAAAPCEKWPGSFFETGAGQSSV